MFARHSCNSVAFGFLANLRYLELEDLSRIDDIFVTLRVPIVLSARCALFRSLVNISIQFLRIESFRFVTVRSKLEESQIQVYISLCHLKASSFDIVSSFFKYLCIINLGIFKTVILLTPIYFLSNSIDHEFYVCSFNVPIEE